MSKAVLDGALRAAARRAAAPGGLWFTERQLYYELCRVLLPWHRAPRRLPFTLAPALTYGGFRAALQRHLSRDGGIPGLLPRAVRGVTRRAAGRHTPEPDLFDYGLPRLLVCESEDIAAMLRANKLPMESACPVYSAAELPLDSGVSRMLTQAERPAVHLLHDASVHGLGFPARLHRLTEVPDGVRIVPLGLRPRQAAAVHLIHGRGPVASRGAETGTEATVTLTHREQEWLSRGRFTEVAAVNPAALLRTVHRMVREVPPARRELSGLRRTRETGFLSWPSA
ncbi:hypothetical protein LHJ74_17925 [Streptomyces sp. N2-109]|uniref:Cyclic nucleotide-binding domain-containing protein n=1 Tax=Streptomyces gossypii TaxID=2883101 RepID=A0ABT2JV28_9ACTN|nr:hypothetical protein [Streptomyces gossypii]MCT2591752.1 hypothetical protein [Streptomyces gossypii]